MARWPRLAAAGSPGTRLVRANVTSVTPRASSTAVAVRRARNRARNRASGWCPKAGDRSRPPTPLLSAQRRDIYRPHGVVGDAGDRGGGDGVPAGLDQRDERADLVHLSLDLLVQLLARAVADRGGGLVPG